MAHSEKRMLEAAQIAYLNCIEVGEKNLTLEGKKAPYTVKDMIMSTISLRDIKKLMEADGKDIEYASFKDIISYSDLVKRDKELIVELSDEALNWKIVDIHDTTTQNGFYGCVIETSENDAIVSIRGSEGFNDYAGAIHDWAESDFGLLNNEETIQMAEVERYVSKLVDNSVLDKYQTIEASGHSLGGNLASHFAVACASSKKAEDICKKITSVCNFDGPGISSEYIERNETAIKKVSNRITHYKWSPVGSLLYNVPGSKEEFLKTRKYYEKSTKLSDKIAYYTFVKHDSRSLIFDDDGVAQRGKEDNLAKALGGISHGLEHMPTITNALYALAESTIGKMIYQKDDGKIGFKLPFVERAEDDYRNVPESCRELKLKCGDIVNEILYEVKDYTTKVMDKMPQMSSRNDLVLEI